MLAVLIEMSANRICITTGLTFSDTLSQMSVEGAVMANRSLLSCLDCRSFTSLYTRLLNLR